MVNIFYTGDYCAIEPVIKPNAVYLLRTHGAKACGRCIGSVTVYRVDPFLDAAGTTSKGAGSTATLPAHVRKSLSRGHSKTTTSLTSFVRNSRPWL
jgi:hypothetical protein